MNKPLTLPDSAGWWLREGDTMPSEIVNIMFSKSDEPLLRVQERGHTEAITPGRWLKVELPTFPAREKARIRLCWAKGLVAGRPLEPRVLLAHTPHNGKFTAYCGGHYSDATDIVWITPEYLDEIQPPKEPV